MIIPIESPADLFGLGPLVIYERAHLEWKYTPEDLPRNFTVYVWKSRIDGAWWAARRESG